MIRLIPSSARLVLASMYLELCSLIWNQLWLMKSEQVHIDNFSIQSSFLLEKKMLPTTLLADIIQVSDSFKQGAKTSYFHFCALIFICKWIFDCLGFQWERIWLICALTGWGNWPTVALGCRVSWFSMLLVVELVLVLGHCF